MPEVVATGPILYDTQNSTFLPERWLKPLPVLNGNCIHPRSDDQVEWAMSGVDKYRDGRPTKRKVITNPSTNGRVIKWSVKLYVRFSKSIKHDFLHFFLSFCPRFLEHCDP